MELIPTKHSDPQLTVFYIASLIIEQLLNESEMQFDDLLASVLQKSSVKAKSIFLYSISLLYSIKKLEYIKESDSFRLVL